MTRPRPPAVWFAEEKPPRKPRLSRERITRAAVALLDADGVEGLTMRRLAARLDAGAMSLYEYVGGKEDVLDLAVDEAVAEIGLTGTAGLTWREALTRQLIESRRVMRRHPWLPALMSTRPLLGPHALAGSEFFYSLLQGAGLEGPRLTAAVGSLTYYVQGYAATENSWRTLHRAPDTEADVRGRAQEYIDRRKELYPTLARHAELGNDDFDGSFALGLHTILDGIEAQLGT
ncbi:TetR/AcrR family transcriptional regulator [Streptomyces sp. NPDC051018]|uniref:TetR/AcrR family transcriptional regulator n=1 Tax=Streptomyces sp. NPDC051018 TaxID=3365639 RepID=UPI0037899BB8